MAGYWAELRQNWRPLLAATFGLGTGYAALSLYTPSVIAPHLIEEFGWSRSAFAALGSISLVAAICIPIAWQMLALRQQSRMTPDAPASTVLSEPRLEALRTIARKPLPTHPTVLDALLAIAALGGHIARNGPPGWQTLRHGLDTLLTVEAAFAARDAQMRPRPPRSGQ